MTRITREEVIARPWEYTSGQWKSAHGIAQPYIAEISPMQYGILNKSARKRYADKREQEWQESAEGYQAWRDCVLTAHTSGQVDYRTDRISREAKSVIIQHEIGQKDQSARVDRDRQLAAAQYHETNQMSKGDRVFHGTLRIWATVTKINAKTVTISNDLGTMNARPTDLYRIDPRSV